MPLAMACRLLHGYAHALVVGVVEWFRDLDAEEWIALGTGVLAVATILLWLATQRILSEARTTTRQQSRAYVLVEQAAISADPMRDDGFGVTVKVKNFGQTPAHNMIECADIWVGAFPLTEPLAEHIWNNPGKSILAPGGYSIQIPTHSKLTPLMNQAISDRSTAIYVYGKIAYDDAFGVKHVTNFRLMCVGQGLALGLFRSCAEGNDYT